MCECIASLIVADFLKTLKKGDDKHEEAQAGHGVPTLGPAEVERTNESDPKFNKRGQQEEISKVDRGRRHVPVQIQEGTTTARRHITENELDNLAGCIICGAARDILERHGLRRLEAEGASCLCLLVRGPGHFLPA